MRLLPKTDQKRLQLLQKWDPSHHWNSCNEERFCILCEQTFNGRQVRLNWSHPGKLKLRCATPGCHGGPSTWVHPGNPLLSEEAWEDWDRLIRDSEATAS